MKLYPFQDAGAAWLQDRRRAYLADVPGLGKTVQVIQALKAYGATRPAVVCPASAVPVWYTESERWGLTVPLTVVSYDSMVRNFERMKDGLRRADVLVFDEAHYLKTATAQRTILALGKEGLVTSAQQRVWLLSGTPSPNHYGELYVPLCALWPETLIEAGIRDYEDFLNVFTVWEWYRPPQGPPRRRIFRSKNGPQLRALLSQHDVMLRRTMDEVGIQLPAIFWQTVPVAVDEVLDGHVLAEHAELATRVEQLDESSFARARHELGRRKVPGVLASLRELLENDPHQKHVVMAYHLDVIAALEEAMRPYGAVTVTGDSSAGAREAMVRAFQTNPSVRVFIGQSVACREAITLTASNMMHIVEPFWTPEYNVQLAGRIRRLTQAENHVFARLYYVPGDPLDEAMTARLAERADALATLYEADGGA